MTGPGQTVLVSATQAPRYIPTPRFIADLATNMTGARRGGRRARKRVDAETRNFSPSDTPAFRPRSRPTRRWSATTASVSDDRRFLEPALGPAATARHRDLRTGSPLYGQSRPPTSSATATCAATSPTHGGVTPTISGGTLTDNGTTVADTVAVTWGR